MRKCGERSTNNQQSQSVLRRLVKERWLVCTTCLLCIFFKKLRVIAMQLSRSCLRSSRLPLLLSSAPSPWPTNPQSPSTIASMISMAGLVCLINFDCSNLLTLPFAGARTVMHQVSAGKVPSQSTQLMCCHLRKHRNRCMRNTFRSSSCISLLVNYCQSTHFCFPQEHPSMRIFQRCYHLLNYKKAIQASNCIVT